MIKLWIYTKDHCAWFDVDSIHEYDGFQFERRNQGVCIFYKQNKKVLNAMNLVSWIIQLSFLMKTKYTMSFSNRDFYSSGKK